MAFVTDSNRTHVLWQPPPTACPTASGAAPEVPSILMHPGGGGGGRKSACPKNAPPAVRETVAGRWLGALEEGGGYLPPLPMHPCPPPPPPLLSSDTSLAGSAEVRARAARLAQEMHGAPKGRPQLRCSEVTGAGRLDGAPPPPPPPPPTHAWHRHQRRTRTSQTCLRFACTPFEWTLWGLNVFVTVVFVLEMAAKMVAYGPVRYWRTPLDGIDGLCALFSIAGACSGVGDRGLAAEQTGVKLGGP